MNSQDEKYMKAALKLAQRGIGLVEPNPAVGAVLVKANQVIGRGWHKKFGGPHAEINALADCENLGVSPKGSTMYVTLEPCCHQAKTGPCTDAIIAAGISRVVAAALDPSQHCGGKGIEQLRQAGLEVQTGICEKQAKVFNAPFIKFTATGKCWVIVKWAQSIDGKLAYSEPANQQWISNEHSRKDAHKLRRRAGAILVGINTVLADDPLLTPRPAKGKKPIRIVLDNNLRIPANCRLLRTARRQPVLIFARQQAADADLKAVKRITKKGAELFCYPDTEGQSNLGFLLDELGRRGIQQVLIEGGPSVLASFLKEDLADELCVYIAPKILGSRGNINITEPMSELTTSLDLHSVDIEDFGGDVRFKGLLRKPIDEMGDSEG